MGNKTAQVRELFVNGEVDPEKIAAAVGCSVNTVKVQWYKYKKSLEK